MVCICIDRCNIITMFVKIMRHYSVLLTCQPTSQLCFSLTSNQHQPPTTSQSAVFFSHNKSAPATRHGTANNARRPRSAREESSPRLPWKKTTYTEETGQQSLSDVLRDFDTEAKVARKHCTHHIPGTERNCLSSLPAQNLHRPHISFARTE